MKVKIIKEISDTRFINADPGVDVGEIFPVLRVKEPDKFVKHRRFLIQTGVNTFMNIPEDYVEIVKN